MATNIPDELRFTAHDEWVREEDDGIIAVGITHHAQDSLGEIVHVEVPDIGLEVEADIPMCEVESVKAVAEIYAPVSGEVVAVNDILDDEPELINTDPYGSWLFKIKMSDVDDLLGLLDAAAYEQKLSED